MNYEFKQISQDRLNDFVQVFNSAFNSKVRIDGFIGKFDTCYTGIRDIGYLAYTESGEPIGFFGMFPCFIQINGQKVLGAQVGDICIAPHHQKRGLYDQLIHKAIELARENGIKVAFVIPSPSSVKGLVKGNWQELERTTYAYKTIHHPKLQKGLFRFWPNYCHSVSERLLKKYSINRNLLKQADLSSYKTGVLRDLHFIHYKNYSNNQFVYIDGILCWMRIKRNWLGVGEIFSEQIPSDFWSKIEKFAYQCKCPAVYINYSPPLRDHLKIPESYLSVSKEPLMYYSLDETLDAHNLLITGCDIDTF
jgi:GNAT superfamily N-acetyltransferase